MLLAPLYAAAAPARDTLPRYTVEDKGFSLVRMLTDTPALNNHGDFAIWHAVNATSMPGMLFHGGQSIAIEGEKEFSLVYPADINDAMTIVGSLQQPQDLRFTRAFQWSENHLTILPPLGGAYAAASAINRRGDIVGNAQTAGGAKHAVLWKANQATDLGLLARGDFSSAHDINDPGDIVGEANSSPNGKPQAFLRHAGVMKQLPGLAGGSICSAQAINNAGDIIGSCDGAHGIAHGVIWNRGAIKDLGSLGEEDAPITALDINNRGEVVGSASLDDKLRAFLWKRGKMINLNTTLPDGSGWLLLVASRINDDGVIVGRGYYHGYIHAFLLRPAPTHAAK